MADVKVNVIATLDSSGITSGLNNLGGPANAGSGAGATGSSGGGAGQSGGGISSKSALDNAIAYRKEVEETYRALQRYQKTVSEIDAQEVIRRTRRSQNAHAVNHQGSFVGLDGDMSPGAIAERTRLMRSAGINTPGNGSSGIGHRTGGAGAYGGKLASGLAGMVGGAMMGGSGGDGASVAGGALGGMIGAALPIPGGAFIGSMVGSMAGGAIGGSLGTAKDEAVGVSDLRHMIGETKTDFDLLRDSTRAAATGLGIAYGESVKLARQFAQTSSAQNSDSLGSEVRIASSLARSLGLDPSSGVGVMGTLRNTHVTEDEAGSRRMGIVIADAINKGGMSSKSDEVLSAIASFAQATARASLQTPNVTGYADFMGRMVGTRTPGLDVQGSASMMGQMDQAVRSHGNVNTDIFKQASLSKYFPGMSSLDLDLMTNQGSMGTMEEVIKDLAKGTGKRGAWARENLNNPNLKRPIQDMLMDGLKQFDTKDNEAMYEQQGASLFNLSHTQFKKFSDIWKNSGGTDGLGKKMSKMGIDPTKLDPMKYARIGSLMGSGGEDLQMEGNKLISGKDFDKNLSKIESDKLSLLMESAKSGSGKDVDALREEVVKLNAGRNTIDLGQAARKDAEDIKNAVTETSGKLLEGVVGVQDAILAMAGEG